MIEVIGEGIGVNDTGLNRKGTDKGMMVFLGFNELFQGFTGEVKSFLQPFAKTLGLVHAQAPEVAGAKRWSKVWRAPVE